MLMADAEDYALIGSFVMLIVWVAAKLFNGAFVLEKKFGMAVSMGRSRKEFILSYLIVYTVNCMIELISILLLDRVERVLAAELYKGLPCAFDVLKELLDVRIVLSAVIAMPVLHLFMGMLVMRFQKMAFWGIWVLWMLVSIGLPKILEYVEEHAGSPVAQGFSSIQQTVASLGATGALCVTVAVSAVLLVISESMLKKQAVTYV